MRLSDVSIQRPVLACVLNLMIVVAGAAGFMALPVREFPDVDPPIVSVSTVYPGAAPETVETSVTEPLEQALNGIEGVRSISSVSQFGQSGIDIEFNPGRSLDQAANDVANAIQGALGELPPDAERPGISKAGAGSGAIMWLIVSGDHLSASHRSDVADRLVKTPVQILPGVARAQIGGGRRYAMRVWLDPLRMAARGVEAADVRRTIRENNLQLPGGSLEGEARMFTLQLEGILADPADYESLVIREDGDTPVRIGDVARVELGSDNYQVIARFDQKPTVGVGIVRQSRSNELAVSRAVRDALPAVRETLPPGTDVDIAVDNTLFVEASLAEVWRTLAIAMAIVVLVNAVALRSLATTVISAIAIPVSLVGTFAVMQALGFSINVLTLLALVLAIGLLVDDSIVVMENIYRRRELGESLLRAARNGAREVGFPVIATTLAVIAVLVPLSLMTGNVGRLFREFAVTLGVAVALSTFVSLTGVPMLCSRWLHTRGRDRAQTGAERPGGEGDAEAPRGALGRGYARVLEAALRHRRWATAGLLLCVLGTAFCFLRLPQTLVPTEDRASFLTIVRAPQGSNAAYTNRALRKVEERIAAIPEVEGFFAAVALAPGRVADASQAIVFTRLRHWGERERSQQQIVGQLFGQFQAIPDVLAFPINPPSIGGGQTSDVHVILQSSSATVEQFERVTSGLLAELGQFPELINLESELRLDNPQLDIRFNREAAADLGVPVRAIAEALQLLVGQVPMDEFVLRNKQYDVVMSIAPELRSAPEQLRDIHVRAADGSMVPLASLIEIEPTVGPTALHHYGLQRSAALTASLAGGTNLGDVLPRVLDRVNDALPPGFSVSLGGLSREFAESSSAALLTFAFALIVIYLVLAAQFESFVHPLSVMLSVPLASLGALAALLLSGHTLNLFSQVGILLLVGLVTKNSILLVDFANQERARGASLDAALRAAGRTRLRPILMTSATSILGSLPLALALGAGAESRRAIGIAVVGGLIFSTVFTLVVIPVVHRGITRLAEALGLNTVPPLVELELELERD